MSIFIDKYKPQRYSGIMITGWYQEGGNIYYFKEQGNDRGAMAIGPMNINGLWYMFDEDGRRLTGLVEYEGDYYYFVEEGDLMGVMFTGAINYNGEQLYFDPANGKLVGSV